MPKPTTVNAKTLIEMGAPEHITVRCINWYGYKDVNIDELFKTFDENVNLWAEEREWLRTNFPWCFEEKPKRYRNRVAFPYNSRTLNQCEWNWNADEYVYITSGEEFLTKEQVESNPDLFEEVK